MAALFSLSSVGLQMVVAEACLFLVVIFVLSLLDSARL